MSIASLLSASAAGSAAAYLLDPQSGRRRRARLRDAIVHARHVAVNAVVRGGSDLEHRAHGALSRAHTAGTVEDLDDNVLVARVRSRLGRVSGSVHSICVTSHEGTIELTGKILDREARAVLRTVRSTRGVRDVVDEMERQTGDTANRVVWRKPAMARQRPGYWSAGTRLVTGGLSTVATLWGIVRGGVAGTALFSIGAAGIIRSATNRPLVELAGIRPAAHGIDIAKTISIHAPIADVYEFFTAFENFPRFMRHVERVERIDDNRWHFQLSGPVGVKADLEAVLLRAVPNELVAWTSSENATIDTTGSARFEPVGPEETRLTIRMTYRPPAGLLGHEILTIFHADPKHELDEDLLRLQSLLETGRATGHDGTVTLDELR